MPSECENHVLERSEGFVFAAQTEFAHSNLRLHDYQKIESKTIKLMLRTCAEETEFLFHLCTYFCRLYKKSVIELWLMNLKTAVFEKKILVDLQNR